MLAVATVANEGLVSSLGKGNGTLNSTADLIINAATLQIDGYGGASGGFVQQPTGLSTNRLFTIGDASSTLNTATIDASNETFMATNGVAGTVTFSNQNAIGYGGTAGSTYTLTFSGYNIGNNTFDPQITNGNGTLSPWSRMVSAPGSWATQPAIPIRAARPSTAVFFVIPPASTCPAPASSVSPTVCSRPTAPSPRGLGTSGASTFDITGGISGLSANGGALAVNVGGAAATLQFGTSTFSPHFSFSIKTRLIRPSPWPTGSI